MLLVFVLKCDKQSAFDYYNYATAHTRYLKLSLDMVRSKSSIRVTHSRWESTPPCTNRRLSWLRQRYQSKLSSVFPDQLWSTDKVCESIKSLLNFPSMYKNLTIATSSFDLEIQRFRLFWAAFIVLSSWYAYCRALWGCLSINQSIWLWC